MTPVNGSLEPCRPAGRGCVGGSIISTSTYASSDEKNINNTENNRNNNDDGIHSGGRPAQKIVQPALPLRYVQKTATEPAHYVFPRPAKAATQPGTGGLKEEGKEKEKQKQQEKRRGKERDKKMKEKEKDIQGNEKGSNANGSQPAKAKAKAKAKASRPRVPKSPTTAQAAVHADFPHNAGDPSHAATSAAAPVATTDISSQSTEAALLTPKPSSQATNESEHAGNQTQIHSNGQAPAKPAQMIAPTGEATLQHSGDSTTETSAQSDVAATHHLEPRHPQDTSTSLQPEAPFRDGQGMRPPEYQPAHIGFRPALLGQPGGNVANGNLPHGPPPPLPTGPRMHQAHPSSTSGLYGHFHDSQSSSPAPPFVGGLPPPPGMPIANGRAPHMMPPNGHSFLSIVPFGTDMMPGSSFDNFPRPAAMPFGGPMDLRPHSNALDRSNPHSFHGSQSSVHPEENGMYPQYPPRLRNGAAGSGEDHRGAPGRDYGSLDHGRMGPTQSVPFRDVVAGDHTDGLVAHIQRQFSSPEFADCYLELRYCDDRAPPMRCPGHRFMLSRSLRLADLVRKQSLQTGPADGALPTILLETRSIWIRSDSFYMALQHLYGLPMLQPPKCRDDGNGGEMTSAGSAVDQFEFAISFAAAGHLLVDNRVLGRGCEIAAQVLTWQTLEPALGFALEGYSDKGSYESYRYGDGSRVLLNAVVAYIIQHFPSNFSLNVDSRELVPFARFPVDVMPSSPTASSAGTDPSSSPSVTSVHVNTDRSTWRLSDIQFGDLPCAEDETPKPPPASYLTLSRILLDIPFPQLKVILESPGTGDVQAWALAETRYKIIKTAVDEREARRQRALEAILAGRVPNADTIREGLRMPEPQDLGPWTAVGWQEDVLPYGNANGPSLGRRWVPIMQSPKGLTPAYP